jgi:hypothetical protein
MKEGGEAWTRMLLDSAVDDPARGEDSTCGLIRRYYTNNYKALDQFDAMWYGCSYSYRDSSWQSCYLWALILDCAVNACSAWSELHGERAAIKDFVRQLVDELGVALAAGTL